MFARQSSSALVSLDNHIAEGENWWMAGVVLHHPQHHLISSDLLSPIFLRFSPKVARKENTKDRPSFILFSFGSIHSIRFCHRYIYKTGNGQQISLILPPLFFLILHKHLVIFFCIFSCFFFIYLFRLFVVCTECPGFRSFDYESVGRLNPGDS